MRLVFIGPPGAGKGTQAARLSRHYGIPHLSTGEILRDAKQAQTKIGRLVAPLMDAGQLINDDLMIGVIRERLGNYDCRSGFLLDGFPRTLPQAEALAGLLDERNEQLDHVIRICVPEAELTRRLLARAKTAVIPRADDSQEAIPKRLRVYVTETSPLIEYYENRKLLRTVDGTGTMDRVFQRILGETEAKPAE